MRKTILAGTLVLASFFSVIENVNAAGILANTGLNLNIGINVRSIGSDLQKNFAEQKQEMINRLCAQINSFKKKMPTFALPNYCIPTPPVPPPAPTVNLGANPTSVTTGQTSVLTWSSTDAVYCAASGGWSGTKALSGNETVTVPATTSYTIACGNITATTTKTVSVTAVQPPPPAPTLNLSALPNPVLVGETSSLTWSSSDASLCVASGGWSGTKSFSGSEVVTINATTTYALSCGNVTATTTKSVEVGAVITPPPQPTLTFTATPVTILQGATSTLNWLSGNANTCTASGGWSGSKSLSGSLDVSPTATTTYTLTCDGDGGSIDKDATVNIVIPPPAPLPPPAPTLDFSALPNPVQIGQTSTLSWSSTDATLCLASDGWSGQKNFSGSEIVTINATTTYTIACGNTTATTTKSVTVNATPIPEIPAPTLTFSATPETIMLRATSTLNWSSGNANTCSGEGGWSGSKSLSGSLDVAPTATTTYTLVCDGDGGSIQKDATVNIVIPPTPPAGTIGHVVISEVYPSPASLFGSATANEWFELYNGGSSNVDLTGWTIWDSATSSHDTFPAATVITAGGFLFVTASSSTAGLWSIPANVPIVVIGNTIGSNGLGNTSDALIIKDTSTTTVDAMSYGDNTSVFGHWATTTQNEISLFRKQLTSDTDTADDWATTSSPTPGSF